MKLTRKSNPKKTYGFKGRMKAYLNADITFSKPDTHTFSFDWLTKRKKILNPKKKREYEILLRLFETPATKEIAGVKVTSKEIRKIEYLYAIEEKLDFDTLIRDYLKQIIIAAVDEHEKTDFFIDVDRSYAEVRC